MKKIIITISLLLSWVAASSAYPGQISFKQQDGSRFLGHLKGDEWFNWVEDTDKNIIQYNNQTKNFEYTLLKETSQGLTLVTSGIKVGDNTAPKESKIEATTLSKIWKQKREQALKHTHTHKSCK